MVNVANGNLIVQSDDVDVPERGIDLAFRRTYNSQSMHDVTSTDGAPASVYGNGWTSTFDAHMAYSAATNSLSVYDIDGARYDYTLANGSVWAPPPGMEGTTLASDGGCGYFWTKKSGTVYYFWAPIATSCVSASNAAYEGRLYEIMGRNHNNHIILTYSWANNDPSNVQNLTSVIANHSDGQSLTLTFAKFGTYTELASITRPDSQQITYSYDSAGNLLQVSRPGNAVDDMTGQSVTSLQESYGYYSGTHILQVVENPRYVWSMQAHSGSPDGAYYGFVYSANTPTGLITQINDYALVNPSPNDGSGTGVIQPSQPGGIQEWRNTQFAYASGTTTMNDTQGHSTAWSANSIGSVTQTKEWTGTQWLVTQASWNTNNDLTASVDPRGYETDYGYDANGNTTWVQQPSVTTSLGSGRPVARYTYDQYNNLVASCDPQYVWTTGITSCTAASGATYYTYDYSDTNEPYGKLTDTHTPLGYHRHITYDSNDYGLPIQVQGDSISQNDGTSRQPTQSFGYNSYGDLTSYNKGNGAWSITYDSLNRPLAHTDPDGVTTYTCYNVDSSVLYTETAAQHAADGNVGCQSIAPAYATAQTYDVDANVVTQTNHYSQTATNGRPSGVTRKYYDGEDRLIEVVQPQDPQYDVYAFPWLTRYIYDLTNNQAVSLSGGASFNAYGNLYKTQECLQNTSIQVANALGTLGPTITGTCSYQDVRGSSFDALDRVISKYELSTGSSPQNNNTYDGNGDYGLLSQTSNGTGQQRNISYDPAGRLTDDVFTDGVTGNRHYTYDPDGRIANESNNLGTVSAAFDADGRITQKTTASGIGNPGTITYSYYGDGMRKTLGLSVPSVQLTANNLFSYNYRADGLRSSLAVTSTAASGNFAWTYSTAGRELTETDPFTGSALPQPYNAQTYVPLSYTYDAYGQIATETLPRNFIYSGFTFDAEGNVLSWTSNESMSQNLVYSTRNEAVSEDNIAGTKFANGAGCGMEKGLYNASPTCTLDARSDSLLSWTAWSTLGTTNYQATHTFVYDAAGRETGDSATCNPGYTYTSTRSYDTDNHIVSEVFPANYEPATNTCSSGDASYPSSVSYALAWSADGHLEQDTQTNSGGSHPQSFGWDGDDLLYTTFNGAIQINIEKLGYLVISGTSAQWGMYDRDWIGNLADSRTQAWIGAVQTVQTRMRICYSPKGCPPPAFLKGGSSDPNGFSNEISYLSAMRSDGYSDGTNSFQGVRAYDINMNQWTTPDAYAGDVHDPMSQKPYVWNGNNAVAYSDPSGYDPVPDPMPAPAPDFNCGRCAPANNNPLPADLMLLFIPGVGEVEADVLIARLGTRFSEGAIRSALNTAEGGGLRSIRTAIRSLEKQITKHEAKIAAAKESGGFTSSMEREVKTFTDQRDALKALEDQLTLPAPTGKSESLHDIFEGMLNNTRPQ